MPEEAKHAVDKCRCLRSSELFAGARVLTILHGQDEYRLQITATGKLILTK
jgi:hemin uptake protein HemP